MKNEIALKYAAYLVLWRAKKTLSVKEIVKRISKRNSWRTNSGTDCETQLRGILSRGTTGVFPMFTRHTRGMYSAIHQQKGCVYLLANPKSFEGKSWYKIGRAKQLWQRIGILNSGMPFPFAPVAILQTDQYVAAEKLLHEKFKSNQLGTSEFYEVDKKNVIDAMGLVRKERYPDAKIIRFR